MSLIKKVPGTLDKLSSVPGTFLYKFRDCYETAPNDFITFN